MRRSRLSTTWIFCLQCQHPVLSSSSFCRGVYYIFPGMMGRNNISLKDYKRERNSSSSEELLEETSYSKGLWEGTVIFVGLCE